MSHIRPTPRHHGYAGAKCRCMAGCKGHAMVASTHVVSLFLLALAIGGLSRAQAQAPLASTLEDDGAALSNFLAGIENAPNTTLGYWDVTTNPDLCSWPGVICNCSQLSAAFSGSCTNAISSSGTPHVIGLDLGGDSATAVQPLQGTIADSIGSLTALVFLNLGHNNLRGPVPATISNLQSLQWLYLDGNALSGPLPDSLGSLPSLSTAGLNDNNFSGPVPASWCNSSAMFRVEDNELLCGAVSCPSRLRSFDGTYLFKRGQSGVGGGCSSSAPYCNPNIGCRVGVPTFWTSRAYLTFNFTEAFDAITGPVRYQWCLGTQPGAQDALPLMNYVPDFKTVSANLAGGTELFRVATVVHSLSSVSLAEGASYYVTVLAWNNAGPPLSTAYTSARAVQVETTGPAAGQVFNTVNYTQALSTSNTRFLEASWSGFADAQSGVAGYTVQFFQQPQNRSLPPVNVTPALDAGLMTQVQVAANITPGRLYFARVTALNGAGISSTASGIPLRVHRPTGTLLPTGMAALAAVLTGLGCLAVGAVAAVYIMRERLRRAAQLQKERQQELRQMQVLMGALMTTGDSGGGPAMSGGSVTGRRSLILDMKEAREFAFVVTDIENSTEVSQLDPLAFGQIQEIHDQLMRECIARAGGYEIVTEGDSFQIAFTTVAQACAFCVEVQYRLLDINWPKRVLQLSACKTVLDDDGEVTFIGPRVRMGLHWAKEGTVVSKLHSVTRHRMFAGPGYAVAQDVGEAAHGAQILLTQDALDQLLPRMAQSGFPVVELVGLYKLPTLNNPVWLYHIREQIGKPLRRSFPMSQRKVDKLWPSVPLRLLPLSHQLGVTRSPVPEDSSGAITFVISRLVLNSGNTKTLPSKLALRLEEICAMQAQQFKGYVYNWGSFACREGIFHVCFSSTMDAVRFCHAVQMLLNYSQFPADCSDFYGASVPSHDGKWLFHGPRLAMAVHRGSNYSVLQTLQAGPTCPNDYYDYAGEVVEQANKLAACARGGQVILSEEAWQHVRPELTQHPGACQVVHLGIHQVSESWPQPQSLVEIMPNLLMRRHFKEPATWRMLEMGYREAPLLERPMCICFVKVSKPDDVAQAEGAGQQQLPDNELLPTIAAYQCAIRMYVALVRRLLRAYSGYECKEPEPGKFTLAFSDLELAIRWACHLQQELLLLPWPARLLQMTECRPEYSPAGDLIWAGLRVRVGMSWGYATSKKPLNTGRADYYGVLPNRAARVMGAASYGQVLLEASEHVPWTAEGQPLVTPATVALVRGLWVDKVGCEAEGIEPKDQLAQQEHSHGGQDPVIQVLPLGYYELRGLGAAKQLYHCVPPGLQARQFPLPPNPKTVEEMMRMPAYSSKSANLSFGSFTSLAEKACSFLPVRRSPSPGIVARARAKTDAAAHYSTPDSPVPGARRASPAKPGLFQREGSSSAAATPVDSRIPAGNWRGPQGGLMGLHGRGYSGELTMHPSRAGAVSPLPASADRRTMSMVAAKAPPLGDLGLPGAAPAGGGWEASQQSCKAPAGLDSSEGGGPGALHVVKDPLLGTMAIPAIHTGLQSLGSLDVDSTWTDSVTSSLGATPSAPTMEYTPGASTAPATPLKAAVGNVLWGGSNMQRMQGASSAAASSRGAAGPPASTGGISGAWRSLWQGLHRVGSRRRGQQAAGPQVERQDSSPRHVARLEPYMPAALNSPASLQFAADLAQVYLQHRTASATSSNAMNWQADSFTSQQLSPALSPPAAAAAAAAASAQLPLPALAHHQQALPQSPASDSQPLAGASGTAAISRPGSAAQLLPPDSPVQRSSPLGSCSSSNPGDPRRYGRAGSPLSGLQPPCSSRVRSDSSLGGSHLARKAVMGAAMQNSARAEAGQGSSTPSIAATAAAGADRSSQGQEGSSPPAGLRTRSESFKERLQQAQQPAAAMHGEVPARAAGQSTGSNGSSTSVAAALPLQGSSPRADQQSQGPGAAAAALHSSSPRAAAAVGPLEQGAPQASSEPCGSLRSSPVQVVDSLAGPSSSKVVAGAVCDDGSPEAARGTGAISHVVSQHPVLVEPAAKPIQPLPDAQQLQQPQSQKQKQQQQPSGRPAAAQQPHKQQQQQQQQQPHAASIKARGKGAGSAPAPSSVVSTAAAARELFRGHSKPHAPPLASPTSHVGPGTNDVRLTAEQYQALLAAQGGEWQYRFGTVSSQLKHQDQERLHAQMEQELSAMEDRESRRFGVGGEAEQTESESEGGAQEQGPEQQQQQDGAVGLPQAAPGEASSLTATQQPDGPLSRSPAPASLSADSPHVAAATKAALAQNGRNSRLSQVSSGGSSEQSTPRSKSSPRTEPQLTSSSLRDALAGVPDAVTYISGGGGGAAANAAAAAAALLSTQWNVLGGPNTTALVFPIRPDRMQLPSGAARYPAAAAAAAAAGYGGEAPPAAPSVLKSLAQAFAAPRRSRNSSRSCSPSCSPRVAPPEAAPGVGRQGGAAASSSSSSTPQKQVGPPAAAEETTRSRSNSPSGRQRTPEPLGTSSGAASDSSRGSGSAGNPGGSPAAAAGISVAGVLGNLLGAGQLGRKRSQGQMDRAARGLQGIPEATGQEGVSSPRSSDH